MKNDSKTEILSKIAESQAECRYFNDAIETGMNIDVFHDRSNVLHQIVQLQLQVDKAAAKRTFDEAISVT